jgi:Tfp pilus assembly protein FimV
VPVSTGSGQPAASDNGKTYVVRAGDSLWLIARRMLAPGTSNAEIAQMVNRLWTLNASRIATGNPDLLGVGVALVLP